MKEFHLPDPGEGLVEADIVRWVVSEGDEVKVNDILVEIETAKSIVELPSPWAGRIARLMVEEGVTVEAERVLATPGRLVDVDRVVGGEHLQPPALVELDERVCCLALQPHPARDVQVERERALYAADAHTGLARLSDHAAADALARPVGGGSKPAI